MCFNLNPAPQKFTRKDEIFFKFTLFGVVLSGFSLKSSSRDATKLQRPNIILINVDDLGWRDVGVMVTKFYETPHIDALDTDGMFFINAYASAANCAPNRACLMSGQWTPRHKIYTVNASERGESKDRRLIPIPNTTVLADSQYILAEALKDAGNVFA